jgi:signal peptidase I
MKNYFSSLFLIASRVIGVILIVILFAMALMTVRVIPFQFTIVNAYSMVPTIMPYSIVLVHRGQYKVDQPITFITPNGVVTHRLVAINADGTLQTKGDAVEKIDPSFEPPDKVIGGVELIIQSGLFWLLGLVVLAVLLWLVHKQLDVSNDDEEVSDSLEINSEDQQERDTR